VIHPAHNTQLIPQHTLRRRRISSVTGDFSFTQGKKKEKQKDEIIEKAHFLLNLDSGFPNKIAFILHNMCSRRLRPCNLARA